MNKNFPKKILELTVIVTVALTNLFSFYPSPHYFLNKLMLILQAILQILMHLYLPNLNITLIENLFSTCSSIIIVFELAISILSILALTKFKILQDEIILFPDTTLALFFSKE